MIASGADPRRLSGDGEADIRPIVARARSGLPVWVFAIGIAGFALLLFSILLSQQHSATFPTVRPRVADRSGIASVPPTLNIPPEPARPAPLPEIMPQPVQTAQSIALPARPQIIYVPSSPAIRPPEDPLQPQPRVANGPVLVLDTTTPEGNDITAASGEGAGALGASGPRVRATSLRNGATTVPQGTLIPAVLETALDSTRPGQARAIVSRDVRGFDGVRVLIPRGSRLLGEYRADLAPGQNRAFVQWSRLIRPDGVTIALGSPAADALGRSGIRGDVNSHFFERFGSALLRTTLDLGSSLATARLGNSPVIVVPNIAQSAAPSSSGGGQAQPTLKVKQGMRVTVFVARDLDFTAVESKPR